MKIRLPLPLNAFLGAPLKSIFLILFITYCRANLFGQTNELIFKDDFSQNTFGINWQPDAFWAIGDGVAYNSDDFSTLFSQRSFSAPSYVIETTVKGFSYAYGRQFHFTFGQADASTRKTYVLSYFPGAGGLLKLGRATENIFFSELLDQVVIYPEFNDKKWQKFKIVTYKSGLIQVYLDKGTGYSTLPLLEAIDSTYQQLGHFGWTVSTQTAPLSFAVDHIEIRTPPVEKPAIREKPAEDSLISQVIAASDEPYKITKLKEGVKPYSDRNYTITDLPAYLQDASFIQAANNDKYNTKPDFLAVAIKKSVVAYVAYDPRATTLPDWLADWEKTNDVIRTTDTGTNYLEIYSKVLENGSLNLRLFLFGGNLASPATGAKTNYLLAVGERPAFEVLEAEKAKVVGAEIATNHTGYSGTGFVDFIHKKDDYIEWTIQTTLAGTYSLGFTFANGSVTERSLAITVDEKDAAIQSFIPIGSWDNWAFNSGTKIYLTKGQHKIRLTATGTSGPNLDFASLYFVSIVPETIAANSNARKAPNHSEKPLAKASLSVSAYPNPFENRATITYSLPEQAAVHLTLYNQQGQKITVLINKTQLAGNYTVALNGANLPKGLYLYRLQTGKQVVSGKIIRK